MFWQRWKAAPAREAGHDEEAWMAALGVAQDTQLEGDPQGGEAGSPQGADSTFVSRQARLVLSGLRPSFERVYRAFLAARAAVGVLVLATELAADRFIAAMPDWVLAVCIAYAVGTLLTWLQPRLLGAPAEEPRLLRRQWLGTIGLDLLTFGALHLLAPRSGLNFVPLLVLPVLMAGVLTPRLAALALTAAVTLLLLGQRAAAWSSRASRRSSTGW